MKWIVQMYHHKPGQYGKWIDIRAETFALGEPIWEAPDAGSAFHAAVISNPEHKLEAVTYRVLPFDGGASFNVGINVDLVPHEEEAHA